MTLFDLLTSKGALLLAFMWLLALAFVPDRWRSAISDWLTRHGWRGEPEDALQKLEDAQSSALALGDKVKSREAALSNAEAKRDEFKHALEGVQSEHDNCKSNLEHVKKEKDDAVERWAFRLVEANLSLKAARLVSLKWELAVHAYDEPAKAPTVRLRYRDSRDRPLAENIASAFWGPWSSSLQDSTKGENPTIETRVVLFSNHKFADSVTRILANILPNHTPICQLGGRVGQDVDIEIQIFDHPTGVKP
jgi:hypothetical protein